MRPGGPGMTVWGGPGTGGGLAPDRGGTYWPFPSLVSYAGQGAAELNFLEAAFSIDPALGSRLKAAALGAELMMSREEVYRVAESVGLSLGKVHGPGDERPPLNMADILWLLGTRSATMETISSCLGICSKSLQRRMRAAGIDSRHSCVAWTDEELAAIILHQRLHMGFGDTGVSFTDGALPFPSVFIQVGICSVVVP